MQNVDSSELTRVDETPAHAEGGAGRRGRRRWPGHLALGLYALAVASSVIPVWVGYVMYGIPSRLAPMEHPFYFPVRVLHIGTATIALVTCGLQVWPWLRRRHTRIHRGVGRLYVLGGVVPASTTVLVVTAFWPQSAVTAVGQVILSALWLCVTTYGFVLAMQGRIADHRRWMLRSFALTSSVLVNQLVARPSYLLFSTQLDTRLAGSQDVLEQVAVATENWVGFVLAFIAVEWWLEREQLRRSARRRPSRT